MNKHVLLPSGGETLNRFKELIAQLEKWQPKLEESLAHGHMTHTFDDLVEMILTNRAHFYSWDEAFAVMEYVQYPQFSVYHCFLAGGSVDGVMATVEPLKKVARALGCRYVSLAGREGWRKPFAARGWEFVCTTLYCDVGED
jgi:hypothetical protein